MKSARSRRPPAFTLIELLAVIAIMIVIGSLIAPAVTAILRGGMMTRATNDFTGILESARTEAMAKNTYVWLGFQNALVTDSSTKKNPLYWQLRVGVVRSKDGSASLSSSNYTSSGNVFRYDNVAIVDTSGTLAMSPTSPALSKMKAAMGTLNLPGVSGTACASTTTFTNSGTTFGHMVVFTPQGEAIAGSAMSSGNPTTKGVVNAATPFVDQFVVGFRKTAGAGDGKSVKTAFLPDATDIDEAAVVFSGGSGQTQTFRP